MNNHQNSVAQTTHFAVIILTQLVREVDLPRHFLMTEIMGKSYTLINFLLMICIHLTCLPNPRF